MLFGSSEIHLAAAKSLEIIGHVTNCCKRPIEGGLQDYYIGAQENQKLSTTAQIQQTNLRYSTRHTYLVYSLLRNNCQGKGKKVFRCEI